MLLQCDSYCGDFVFWYLVSALLFCLSLFLILLAYNVVLSRRLSSELRSVYSNVCGPLFDVANRTVAREQADSAGEVCSSLRGREGVNLKAKVSQSKG
jgi:hypothetical protein